MNPEKEKTAVDLGFDIISPVPWAIQSREVMDMCITLIVAIVLWVFTYMNIQVIFRHVMIDK